MMRSRLTILILLLLMIMGASNVFAQTAVLLPSGDIPTNAYVNGPGGNPDDNYYFLTIKITYIAAAGAGGTTTITLPTDITVADVDEAAGATNNYDDEVNISWDAGAVGDFTLNLAGGTNASTIIINEVVAPGLNDNLYVMFPIECTGTATGTANITIVFSDANLTDINDLEVTYTDPTAMSPLTLTALLENVVSLETTYYGLFYPATAAAMTAILPDLADEGGIEVFGSAVGVPQGVLLAIATFDDANDANDMIYTMWLSDEADLGHISEGVSGAVKARTYDPLGTHDIDYIQNEGGTFPIRFIASTFSEVVGDIYVYITSDLTGDFVLGRSDPITIHHEPVVKRVVVDYDGTGGYEPGIGAGLDDYALTLDTGLFLSFDGLLDTTKPPRGYVDIYFQVDDYDDNASVAIFRGTVDDLVDAVIDFTGTTINGIGSGATAAVKLADGFEENADDDGGYISWRWTLPTDASYVPADEYFIYVVATDGSNAHLSVSRGFANWTDNLGVTTPLEATLSVTVANSPKLIFDTLQEYDSDATPNHEMTIETADDDVLMINWGKAWGIDGDADIDDDATIELYIVFNTDDDNPDHLTTSDNAGADALRLAQSLNDGTDGVHLIWSGGIEGDDEQSDNWYAWNLREDLVSTGWFPTLSAAGGAADDHYHLYAIIDEDGPILTDGIARIVALNTNDAGGADGDTIVQAGDTLDRISFANSGYAHPINPPQKGATTEATQTFRFEFDAYDFDEAGAIGIFLLRSDVVAAPHDITELKIGPMTTTPAKLATATSAPIPGAYLINSTTGDDGATPPYVAVTETEGSELYYDWTPIAPGGTSPYTTNLNAQAQAMADGEYYVYVGIDAEGGNFGGAETLYRAPGTLTITGLAATGPQRTFTLSPAKITPTLGDDTTIIIRAVDNGTTVDMADFYVEIPKAYFNVANQSSPCTIGATMGAAGLTLINNETIDDDANGRWIVHCTLWKGSAYFGDIANNGIGTEVARFQVSCLGTTDAVEASTSINYLTTSGYLTRYEKDGVEIPAAGIANMSAKVQPRTIMEGVVQFQGRDVDSGALVTFELRNRGKYEPVSDTTFDLNDDDGTTDGVQIQLDTQGKFQLTDVPNGDWDMVVKYDRYLASKQEISTGPGIDNLLVDFGELLGGDSGGYTDVSGNDIPNNAVNQEDVTKITSALGNTDASAGWGAPDNNRYCDVNESGTVTIADLSIATTNYTAAGPPAMGAQPVFLKPAVRPDFQSNLDATVEFMNVPAEFKAGETYTIQVIVKGAADVKGYFINLEYDKEALSLGNIIKGDFFTSKTASRAIVKDSMVGLANAVYGPVSFAGDGILAEVSFTANMDAVFSPAVLGLREATFVNSRFMEDNLDLFDLTYVENISPASFELNQNFPNPFNPTTTISFNVPTQSVVSIKVYDILGRYMRTLVDGSYSAGNHSVVWNATDMNGNEVSAGVYFYTIESGNFRETRRMLFMK